MHNFVAYTAVISLVQTYYNVTEPGTVEVGILLTGSIESNVAFIVQVNNATATGLY